MSSWEDRMAQRAAEQIDFTAPAPDLWGEAHREAHREARRQALEELDSLTLGEAVANLRSYVPYGCACPGPPVCCWEYISRYRNTKQAAHIAVKQIAELARRAPDYCTTCGGPCRDESDWEEA